MKDGKFEVGDRVMVIKPHDNNTILSWHDDMDQYDGKIYTIEYIIEEDYFPIKIVLEDCNCSRGVNPPPFPYSWRFSTNWLKRVGFSRGLCQNCGSEMEEILLLTSTTRVCPKCKE
jgi:hypothetical protein